jgi:hypothetical protein
MYESGGRTPLTPTRLRSFSAPKMKPKPGDSLDDFLDDFPGVSREQAVAYLEMAREAAEGRVRAGAPG